MTQSRTLALVLLAAAALTGCPKEIKIPINPPEARKDYKRTALNTPVVFSPLLNDYDPNSEVMTIVAVGPAAHGTAVNNGDGTVTYTPNTGYLGGDAFEVTITDASGNQAADTAHVTVGPSSRFIFVSNFADYYTRELYMSDSEHPGIAIPVSGRVQRTVGPYRPLQGMFASGGPIQFVQTADGQGVAYWMDDNSSREVYNLFYADLATPGVAAKLTDFNEDTYRQTASYVVAPAISPDKQYIYYLSNEFHEDFFDLVRVEVANPANKTIMNAVLTELTVTADDIRRDAILNFKLSDDGQYLVYSRFNHSAVSSGVGAIEIMRVAVASPTVETKLNGTPTTNTNGGSTSLLMVPGTDQLLYLATEGGIAFQELYLVDFAALTAPVKVSGTGVGSGITSFKLSADGSRVVYIGTENTATVRELYTVQLSNPGVSTRISKPRTASLSTDFQFLIGPDNTYAIYLRDDDTAETQEIYFVDFAAPSVQVKLNHAFRTRPPGVTKEQALQVQVSAGAPRTVLFTSNDDFTAKKDPFTQSTWIVSVDAPTVTTRIGEKTGVSYLVLWSHDGENITKFDDPEQLSVISAWRARVSDPTFHVKLTPEQYRGALPEVSLTYPFLP